MNYILIEENAFEELKTQINRLVSRVDSLTNNNPQWLDIQEACMALNISKRTLQYYRSCGILPYSYIGNKAYYKATDIVSLLAKHAVSPKTRY